MEILKKPKYIFITALQVILLISTYFINYFTIRKMGMARHMMYLNDKLPEFIQIYGKPLAFFVFAFFSLLATSLISKKKGYRAVENITRILSSFLIIVVFMLNPNTHRAFYIMIAIYSIVIILEYLKVLWVRNDL